MINLAILPSIILFVIVWRADKIEKEPASLLLKLFFLGALTIISAVIIGQLGEMVFQSFLDTESMVYIAIDNFLLTALVEEGGKYFVLKKGSWKHPAFNYTFDAVVYAVVVSLGFATFENILYVMEGGVSTAITRGILSVPGHVIDAIFMGCYYGIAKKMEAEGNEAGMRSNLVKALLIPTLLHGFYDFCLSTGYDAFLIIFFVFEIVITILAIIKFKGLSRSDTQIIQENTTISEPLEYKEDEQDNEKQDF
ncbi:MAG: PrsW family intramembrane metalloprotease [Lachnospiraceae bacterium]|nr:PrsW family intramembrane metalloprotease [Lachnospiraceae bacterium]